MRYWRLLWAMIGKETRTTMRERNQLLGIAIAVLALVAALAVPARQLSRELSRPRPAISATSAAEQSPWQRPEVVRAVRWTAIGIGAGLGFFFSLGYFMSATLATFVGEKEAKTLEILLAAPIGDTSLFVLKCLSVLLPMAAIGEVFVLAAMLAGMALLGPQLAQLPINLPLYVLVLSLPIILLPGLALVGLGAAISAKADTMKGAGQVLGAVFFVIFFGGGYGLPLLFQYGPIRQPAITATMAWLRLPFALQYGLVLGALAVPAIICLGLGRAMFRRDRLLA